MSTINTTAELIDMYFDEAIDTFIDKKKESVKDLMTEIFCMYENGYSERNTKSIIKSFGDGMMELAKETLNNRKYSEVVIMRFTSDSLTVKCELCGEVFDTHNEVNLDGIIIGECACKAKGCRYKNVKSYARARYLKYGKN